MVIGFDSGISGFGDEDLAHEFNPQKPLPAHRQQDIIEAGLRYVLSLPKTTRKAHCA